LPLQAGLALSVTAWLALLRLWCRGAGRGEMATPGSEPAAGPAWRRLLCWAGGAGCLLVLTLADFHYPLRLHFWGGGDEHTLLTSWPDSGWSPALDRFAGRPLIFLPVLATRLLTPDRIEGFLILPTALCLANGLLLAAILARFFRAGSLVPLAGAALLIVNPSDPSRFYVLWTTNFYWTTVFLFLLGVWLYLAAYQRGSRALL